MRKVTLWYVAMNLLFLAIWLPWQVSPAQQLDRGRGTLPVWLYFRSRP